MILTTDSRIIGIDSNNKQVRLCRFEVDAISDLPAPDVWTSDGVIICMGSTAHVIGDNSEHMLDSSGQWVQQVAGTSSYTRAEIDALLIDKVDNSTYATDKAAIDAEIAALTPAVIKSVDDGAKNVADWSESTSTIENVTFTINADKTVSTSGTATARSQKPLFFTVPSTLKAGRYVLSGCPNGGAQSGKILYCLYLWDTTANARVASGNDTGNGLEFDWIPDSSHTYNISVDVRSGTNASGLIFEPMICTAADWAVSKKFVPYAPTNRELYEMILAL